MASKRHQSYVTMGMQDLMDVMKIVSLSKGSFVRLTMERSQRVNRMFVEMGFEWILKFVMMEYCLIIEDVLMIAQVLLKDGSVNSLVKGIPVNLFVEMDY